MDNVERSGPDMSTIRRDTFGETLEFRVRVKSNAHVHTDIIKRTFELGLDTTIFDVIFIKENPNFHREE